MYKQTPPSTSIVEKDLPNICEQKLDTSGTEMTISSLSKFNSIKIFSNSMSTMHSISVPSKINSISETSTINSTSDDTSTTNSTTDTSTINSTTDTSRSDTSTTYSISDTSKMNSRSDMSTANSGSSTINSGSSTFYSVSSIIKSISATINSISGPTKGSSLYAKFVITLTLMIICGSCNDFLGKLIYQMFPGIDNTLHGIDALKEEYWITFSLTFSSFLICSVAIFSKSSLKSYHKINSKLVIKIFVPSIMDFFITGGRYLGLVFLSGAVVSILKNGTQLLFLASLRRCFHRKILECPQLFGITISIIGLLIVAAEKLIATYKHNIDESDTTFMDSVIGISIMFVVGFVGAVRNDMEEVLLKNDNLDSDFVVGMESIVSLIVTTIMGIILFFVDPFDNIGNKSNVFKNIYNKFVIEPGLIVCFVLFVMAIYGKDTMQMRMTSLSSSLTRKLFQQIYPSVTWVISLIAFLISINFLNGQIYGEGWEGMYSLIRLSGFIIVLIGNYFYIKGNSFFAKYFACYSKWKGKTTELKKNININMNMNMTIIHEAQASTVTPDLPMSVIYDTHYNNSAVTQNTNMIYDTQESTVENTNSKDRIHDTQNSAITKYDSESTVTRNMKGSVSTITRNSKDSMDTYVTSESRPHFIFEV